MKNVILFIAFIIIVKTGTGQKIYDLDPVIVNSERKPDTVFGTWKFSVEDYEFYEDKLLLLTFERNLNHPKVMLADDSQKILSSFSIPDEAKRLYKDYLGFINIICAEHIYRIKIKDNTIHLASLPVEDYKRLIMPCIDTLANDIYFSNYSKDYPEFTYYAYNPSDKKANALKTVTDYEQLAGYNMEYYFLKPKQRLECRKLADEYNVDRQRVAAAMSGLTTSVFYTPLYAPLFIMRDTVLVFDHYSNSIFKYNNQHQQIDSIPVSYNHPQNWREWKHQLIVDKEANRVYAVYQKNGFYSLKQIDIYNGKITGTFKLTYKYVKNIKIKDGYVYYVYRPFESLQEQFIYKELISVK